MRRRHPYWEYAVVGGGQLLTGLIVLAVGVYYDAVQQLPSILTLAGLGLLAGPGFWVAFRRASRMVQMAPERPALRAVVRDEDDRRRAP